MKQIACFFTLIGFCFSLRAQTNFKWEKIDSIPKTQSKIYSETKMFIAETWKSSRDVIQNDDKEGGIILVKGASIRRVSFMMGEYVYIYKYNITFRMKDNKYKMTIENVSCEDAHMATGAKITCIEPFDGENCPATGTFSAPGIPRKKAIIMMADFKLDLKNILDNYGRYIKKDSKTDDNW